MKRFLNYIWRFWFLILLLFSTTLCGVFAYIFSFYTKTSKICYFFIRLWCIIIFYGMGFSYELIFHVEKELITRQKYIFISNHTSMMDIMLMCVLHPKHSICFVGKAELEKIPIFGTFYRKIFVTVDRKNPKSRAEVYIKCIEKMKRDQNIVIYPEGGVSDDKSILLSKFKDGAFSLAYSQRVPIVVYTFLGLKEMFPFDLGRGWPGKIKVIQNDILYPSEYEDKEELKNTAFKLIHQTLLTNS